MKFAPLADVCQIEMGQAPAGSSYNEDRIGLPLIAGASDLGDVTPTPTRFTDAPTKICEPGDLILCIRATIGDLNVADQPYCLGRGVAGLRPSVERLDHRYLWQWLSASGDHLRSLGRGATFLQISKKDLASLAIPLPPLSEQKRIAAILDAADALREKRRESLELLDKFVQSVFLDMFGDPVTNPKGWKVASLGTLLSSVDSGWSPTCLKRPATEDEWGVLKLGAVTWGRYDQSEQKALPQGVIPRPENEVRSGDLLFARKNTAELVAATAYVWETRKRLLMPDLVFRLQVDPSAGLNPIYLWQLLTNPSQRKVVQRLATGAAGSMPNISKTRLTKVEIPVAPVDAQKMFARVVRANEHQRQRVATHLTELDALFASLQSRAFRGEL